MDPRAAIGVSPIYLESLRTYEHFASSDSLFDRALQKFDLRKSDPGRSIEGWKNRVLRVEIPRTTKILEVRVTLPDAAKAHAMARFLADETVKLNVMTNVEGDQELRQGAERELTAARENREQARAAYLALLQSQPVDALESAVQSLKSRRFAVERDLLDEETLLAELAEREKLPPGANDSPVKRDAQLARTRVAHLQEERKRIEEEITKSSSLLASRTAQVDQARGRLRVAEETYDALESKVRESRGAAGHRGERLRLIDPGVVPERPSSPNGPLNVVVAFLAAMVIAVVYATFEFGAQRRSAPPVAIPLRVANRRGDD
jgi:capsular polysaccharide biosynthesis protein